MSSKFKDKKGNEYSMDITVGTIKRVRQLCEVDLMDVGSSDFLDNVVADEIKMVDMFYVIIKDQADEMGISDVQFGESMAGDTIDEASKAFMEGLTSFFRPSKREATKKLLAKTNQVVDGLFEKAGLEVESIDTEKAIQNIIESIKTTT